VPEHTTRGRAEQRAANAPILRLSRTCLCSSAAVLPSRGWCTVTVLLLLVLLVLLLLVLRLVV
jgi:hypothetical protein